MISFDEFIIDDNSPIYLQIIRYIKQGIAAGVIGNQEEMPSRRVLSALLGVNPNTIQKAYRILEEEGIICSRSGAKSYVDLDEKKAAQVKKQLLESDTLSWLKAMKQMGLSREETMEMAERMWEEER